MNLKQLELLLEYLQVLKYGTECHAKQERLAELEISLRKSVRKFDETA